MYGEEKKSETRKQRKIRKNIEKICGENKKRIKETIKEYVIITFGCLFMAIGVSLLLLPNELSTGGFSGISTILYYLFKLPLGSTMLILNIPLLLLAYFKIGKKLFVRSIYGTIMLSVLIDILDRLTPITHDKFLGCIYGGIMVGIGTAIILKYHGSTGGSDLLSYIIRAYQPQFRSSTLILIIDAIIIGLNVFFFRTIEIGLYSAIAIYLMGKMIDIIFEGVNFTKVMLIVSPHYKEIADKIGTEVNRGSTGLYSKGMYTDEEKMTLLCVGSRTESYAIQSIAKKVDNAAFIIVLNSREVLGKGFK
ncbi:MAG: YitT family protein [Clostridia bacterium]